METVEINNSILTLAAELGAPPDAELCEQADQAKLEEINLDESYKILNEMLAKANDGSISSKRLREELTFQLKCENARDLVVKLTKRPDVFRIDRSFYSKAAFEEAQKVDETYSDAELVSDETLDDEPEPEQPKWNGEERRLCKYIKVALDKIYWGQFGPEDAKIAFNVCDDRPGRKFENVDLLAIDWRSNSRAELIAVEAKLRLTAEVISQAMSYQRFCHRVWVAVVVSDGPDDAGRSIRVSEPGLFEYIVSKGLGLLGCRRKQGKAYEVFPIHWPMRRFPDPVELDLFTERYRGVLEEAMVVQPEQLRFPKLF